MLIASAAGEEWALAEGEAALLGDKLADVCEEYSLVASRKAMLWIDLISVAAIVYGPRVAMMTRKPKRPPPAGGGPGPGGSVIDMPPPGGLRFQ